MAGRRGGNGELWLLLLVLFFALGGLTAASGVYRVVVTLGYLGGIARAWYLAYNGSTYYGLWTQAGPALARIAAMVRSGSQDAARGALHEWLRLYDPLGLVHDAIEEKAIEELPYLFGERR